MAELCLLSEGIQARLRSGVAVTSMVQAVVELVDNSIDAGSSNITITLDYSKYQLQVADDGKGINESDLALIGDRYVTSKCHTLHDLDHNLQHLGYRGEALASIRQVAKTLEISSRHKLSQITYNKLFLNGQVVSVAPAKRQRSNVGTTITATNFFYNMPVRRRAMQEVLELEKIKKAVESIALVHPSVAFTVRNEIPGTLILQTHNTHSVLSNFGMLFAGDKVGRMKNVCIEHSKYKITGYMSTQTHHNSCLQFIYVNCRIVKKTPLHICVNSILNNSLLTKKPKKEKLEYSSPTRLLDKHPIYVLMIECPRSEYDICLEPAKTLVEFKHWNKLLALMTSLTNKFINDNHLYIGSGKKIQHSDQEAKNSTSSKDEEMEATGIQANGSCELLVAETGKDQSSHSLSAIQQSTPSLGTTTPSSFALNKPSTGLQASPLFLVPYNSPSPKISENILSCIHSKNSQSPYSSLKLTVFSPLHSSTISDKIQTKDTISQSSQASPLPSNMSSTACTSKQHRTLNITRPLQPAPQLSQDLLPPLKASKLTHTHSVRPSKASYSVTSSGIKWRNDKQAGKENVSGASFESLLKNWTNPIFQAGPENVLDIGCANASKRQIKVHSMINKYTFTKDMFQDITVLNQVDNKFIACLMKNKDGRGLLVMVDQHAAHERVRLEASLQGLYEECGTSRCVKSSLVQPSLTLSLPPSLIYMTQQYKKHLHLAGVCCTVSSDNRLIITSLPSVLVSSTNRPTVPISTVQDMVTGHLELLQVTSGGCSTMPQSLTHILNSQACHGAIKFGDSLSVTECWELIQLLSQCELPFQCAHGRPSLVPVVDLDTLDKRYSGQQEMLCPNLTNFVKQFQNS